MKFVFTDALHFAGVHWIGFVVFAVAACAVIAIYRFLVTRFGPADLTGNGIVAGAPKVFDNRTLTLMMEQLNGSLSTFSVLNQAASQNLGSFQQESSETSSRRFGLRGLKTADPKKDGGSSADKANAEDSKPGAVGDLPKNLALGASDILGEQLNFVYQIFNLRVLNERSLSDRLFQGAPRMQIVLGFQISIEPPAGAEDCAAVVEIAVAVNGNPEPVSVVALIPQEKTYNSATLSSSADSLDGSVVSRVFSAEAGAGRQKSQLFLHRDSDTLAFERDTQAESGAFGLRKPRAAAPGSVFGWQFRPVLGRRIVSPGTRQMLAVVALPCADASGMRLDVSTRAYWRGYQRSRQTTSVRWAWWPAPTRLGKIPAWTARTLALSSSQDIEEGLSPLIQKISWVDAGSGMAVILVEGSNFFPGTEVTIGGQVHRSAETGLVIKSDRALEIRTTVQALAEGDAVLSGRFGASKPLAIESTALPGQGVYIFAVTYLSMEGSQYVLLNVTVKVLPGGPFGIEQLRELPDPVLYVADQPVAGPYDFYDHGIDNTMPVDAVRVQAWAPSKSFLAASPVVAFRIPFCGSHWAARTVLQPADPPVVERLGSADGQTTLVISSHNNLPDKGWTVRLDKNYAIGDSSFTWASSHHLLLTVPTAALAQGDKLLLSIGTDVAWVLPIPPSKVP